EGRHHLAWDFAERAEEAEAGVSLAMESATANGYLQGRESLAVAIARGRVRCSGDLRTTIVYLPALRLLVEPYRAWVERLHPDLSLA
ncbi:MAG TPA: hypothetical protein VD766_04270, partial [Solirubrobacterales bacterium]|nr:hypothetical protein [Solirubrobacterales bacterium]